MMGTKSEGFFSFGSITNRGAALFASSRQNVSIAPLITFRIVFGLLMFLSLIRFWYRGWITSVYVTPQFHFTYMGFEWVHPLGDLGMHLLFLTIIIAALLITLGLFYRIATVIFFIGFTYVELLDVTTYLNHYYFITLVAFLMIWLPANRDYSLDVLLQPEKRRKLVPAWTIGILRFQMAIVYIFAGLAKLDPDWLLDAQPMRTWLPAKTHLPIVGVFMYKTWVAYLFSWFGAVYDLFIVFFLINRKTRPYAYGVVVIFHIATAIFFPGIGMFPYVMIACSLIFFSGEFHERLQRFFPFYDHSVDETTYRFKYTPSVLIAIYIFLQLVIPLRFLLYPGHLFWHEEGYRFSWRVMLMEKAGSAYFTVKDKAHTIEVNNAEFLTPLQEKMMCTQPDLILKYAHHLAATYKTRGLVSPQVYGEIYVSLNGERSKLFIDTTANLAAEPVSWKHYNWVLPYSKQDK
ncbi:HTTM domain-containing protein [Chitinophaga sp. SYP-B3965]|uniref:HTTM domain-containing protein n=1 Tax=Chitinophaga sp. SYP-B3965 TaxID=2663120 RepID=UPI001C12CCC7|nr:HTTM domain-containing protein [Chitinophaga sp. SYP-B3965]